MKTTIKTKLILKENKVRPLIEQAKGIKIIDNVTLGVATEVLSQANILLDQVVEYKETKTKPLNQALRVIRAETKPFEELLEKVVETVKGKMTIYHTDKIKKQREDEAKILLKVEQGHIDAETAVNKLAEVKEAVDTMTADSGSIKFKEYEGFRIADVTLIPHEYLLVNEPKIRQAMKDGVKLPGVEYYKEMRPTNYRN